MIDKLKISNIQQQNFSGNKNYEPKVSLEQKPDEFVKMKKQEKKQSFSKENITLGLADVNYVRLVDDLLNNNYARNALGIIMLRNNSEGKPYVAMSVKNIATDDYESYTYSASEFVEMMEAVKDKNIRSDMAQEVLFDNKFNELKATLLTDEEP